METLNGTNLLAAEVLALGLRNFGWHNNFLSFVDRVLLPSTGLSSKGPISAGSQLVSEVAAREQPLENRPERLDF